PDGDVLSGQLDSGGVSQIYRSKLSGGDQVCLTCATVKGPNALPQERPQGDWILFESYGQQPTHVGTPGLGGYGGDLYVIHPDGSHVHRLTTSSDPDRGAQYPGGRHRVRQFPRVLVAERQAHRVDALRGRPAVAGRREVGAD